MNNLLVTGGSGFIGSNFIRKALKDKINNGIIVNLDILSNTSVLNNLEDIKSNKYIYYKGDINNSLLISSLLKKYNINSIIHFAAQSHVDKSIKNPEVFVTTNIMGTMTVLNCFKDHIKNKKNKDNYKFIHISTDEVYGSLSKGSPSFTENSQYLPNSPYAASKAASDHLVRAYNQTYDLPTYITNCSNNYGPYQYPEKLIPITIYNCINKKNIPIYGNGKQIRDWLHVDDHCDAIFKILKTKKKSDKYNIGGQKELTNIELINRICSIMDDSLPLKKGNKYINLIKFVSDRPGHDFRYSVNISKINKELNWRPKIEFDKGLKLTVEWYLKNQEWFKNSTESKEFKDWEKINYSLRDRSN